MGAFQCQSRYNSLNSLRSPSVHHHRKPRPSSWHDFKHRSVSLVCSRGSSGLLSYRSRTSPHLARSRCSFALPDIPPLPLRLPPPSIPLLATFIDNTPCPAPTFSLRTSPSHSRRPHPSPVHCLSKLLTYPRCALPISRPLPFRQAAGMSILSNSLCHNLK
jgi:hypothetical protein